MYQDIDFSDFSSASDMNKWQEQCWMPLLTNYKFSFQFSPFCNQITHESAFALDMHLKKIADALFLYIK